MSALHFFFFAMKKLIDSMEYEENSLNHKREYKTPQRGEKRKHKKEYRYDGIYNRGNKTSKKKFALNRICNATTANEAAKRFEITLSISSGKIVYERKING